MVISRSVGAALAFVAAALGAASVASALDAPLRPSVLFIGNSFTYAHGSAVRFYRAGTVTDLNGGGVGGVPALVKSFAQQAGIEYDVFLETRGGAGLDYHLEKKRDVIGKRGWDKVVMHGYSTLDREKPRDPAKLAATSREMAAFLRGRNPGANIFLMASPFFWDMSVPGAIVTGILGAWFAAAGIAFVFTKRPEGI